MVTLQCRYYYNNFQRNRSSEKLMSLRAPSWWVARKDLNAILSVFEGVLLCSADLELITKPWMALNSWSSSLIPWVRFPGCTHPFHSMKPHLITPLAPRGSLGSLASFHRPLGICFWSPHLFYSPPCPSWDSYFDTQLQFPRQQAESLTHSTTFFFNHFFFFTSGITSCQY